ncbi:hypothetical protein V2J09_017129 [Rumex salicifolius]
MNDKNQKRDFCYQHPKQPLVGVCPFCLNEKLLSLETNQARRSLRRRFRRRQEEGGCRKAAGSNIVGLPKMIALGSILNRLELRRRRRCRRRFYGCDGGGSKSDHNSQSTSTSLDDSFISIKFEENGVAFWDNNKVGKAASQEEDLNLTKEGIRWRSVSNSSTLVELPNGTRALLRWRKRIGHMLTLVKWKKSNYKGNINIAGGAPHVNGVGGMVKVRRKGWLRTLTRKKNQQGM